MPNIIQRQIKLEQINILSEPDQNIDCVQLAPIKGLVFSGCGAKAIAYSGFLKYIQQSQHLQSTTHVSGASSGALFATMFALGMDALDIQFIQTHLDMNLLR